MKFFLLFIAITALSCAQKTKNNNNEPVTAQDVVDTISEVEEVAETFSEQTNYSKNFKEEFEQLPLKKVPVIDTTTFGSFKNNDDIKLIDATAFSLPEIYENWYVEGYNYRVISGYRLQLSDDFYTAILTITIGDNELKSVLINYTKEGAFIDSYMVSYDEMAEGQTRYTAEIDIRKIIRTYYMWPNEDANPVMETSTVKIKSDGKLEEMGIEDIFYDLISEKHNISISKQIPKLNTFKVLPYSPNEAVVLIPEIAEGNPEEMFALNSHIALVNIQGREVTHYYFESAKTNGRVSDAIRLDEIQIDIPAYSVNEETKVFEVKVKYYGSSRVNPYYQEAISLFVKDEDYLKKVLDHYSVEESRGELDGPCEGKTVSEKKTFIVENAKTNGHFDITVKNYVSETVDFEDENGECQSKETTETRTTVLKYNGLQYVEYK